MQRSALPPKPSPPESERTPAVAGAVLVGTIAILMTLATTADTRRDP